MCVSLHSKHTPDLKRKNKRDECVAAGGEQQLCTLPLGSVEWLPLCFLIDILISFVMEGWGAPQGMQISGCLNEASKYFGSIRAGYWMGL